MITVNISVSWFEYKLKGIPYFKNNFIYKIDYKNKNSVYKSKYVGYIIHLMHIKSTFKEKVLHM